MGLESAKTGYRVGGEGAGEGGSRRERHVEGVCIRRVHGALGTMEPSAETWVPQRNIHFGWNGGGKWWDRKRAYGVVVVSP